MNFTATTVVGKMRHANSLKLLILKGLSSPRKSWIGAICDAQLHCATILLKETLTAPAGYLRDCNDIKIFRGLSVKTFSQAIKKFCCHPYRLWYRIYPMIDNMLLCVDLIQIYGKIPLHELPCDYSGRDLRGKDYIIQYIVENKGEITL